MSATLSRDTEFLMSALRKARGAGLTALSHVLALAHLSMKDDGDYPTRIAAATGVSSAAMTGIIDGDEGIARLRAGEAKFVLEGGGVRCVADQNWVTSAETCEAALAYLAVGERDMARSLFEWAQINRDHDGAYFTGMALPERVNFPGGERSAYTAAAVILAADALSGSTTASRLLWHQEALPLGGDRR